MEINILYVVTSEFMLNIFSKGHETETKLVRSEQDFMLKKRMGTWQAIELEICRVNFLDVPTN